MTVLLLLLLLLLSLYDPIYDNLSSSTSAASTTTTTTLTSPCITIPTSGITLSLLHPFPISPTAVSTRHTSCTCTLIICHGQWNYHSCTTTSPRRRSLKTVSAGGALDREEARAVRPSGRGPAMLVIPAALGAGVLLLSLLCLSVSLSSLSLCPYLFVGICLLVRLLVRLYSDPVSRPPLTRGAS